MRNRDGPSLFVWSVWAVMSAALAWYALRFGSDLPYQDDWGLAPLLSGAEPLTLDWIWRPNDEHRWPIGTIVQYGLARLSGGDGRAPMMVSAALLIGVTAGWVMACRRVRGRTAVVDAVFPFSG